MTIETDIQSLAPGALVELFELDATALGGEVVRFHAGTNALQQAVVWQGATYPPYPVQATGFEWNGQGTLPRPKLTVANVTGLITGLVLTYDDLLGAKVTRRRTLAQYLDAVNFPGGVNPSADPEQALPDEIWFINQKTQETKSAVAFELTASFDVAGVQLPKRQFVQNTCPWKYLGAECSWVRSPTAGPFYDRNDHPVASAAQDVCGKRLSSCKVRFGAHARLPYGGFPSAGIVNLNR